MLVPKAAMVIISIFVNVALHKRRKEIPMKYITTALLIAVTAGSFITPQVAMAGDPVTFKLQATELNSVAGREQLLVRIKSSAKKACMNLGFSAFYTLDTCRVDIETQWITAINNPTLTALVRNKSVNIASASR
jgi:UrcA family protein